MKQRDNKKKYFLLIENIIGIWMINKNAYTTYANQYVADMLGYTKNEMQGKHIFSFMDKHGIEIFQRNLERLRQGIREEFEFDFFSKDGSRIFSFLEVVPLLDNKGNYIGAFAGVKDTTKRKKGENDLKESEERFKSVVDNIGIGVSLISPAMEILSMNKQMREWFPDIDVTKKPICYRVFNKPPQKNICHYCPTCKTLKNGRVHESITDTPAGEKIINYRIISSAIKNKEGKIIAAIEMVEDITRRKEIEDALKTSREELHEQKLALEQKNLAFKEIIEHIERTKIDIKENVAINVNEILLPILKKLKIKGVSSKYINLLQYHLENLVSSFGHKITEKTTKLTAREIEICNMLKGGFTSKEASELLNIARQTIEKHRKNIRKKLNISNKKVNLISFLQRL